MRERYILPEWLEMHGEDPNPQANPWIWKESDSIELLGILGVEVGEGIIVQAQLVSVEQLPGE